MLKISDHGRFWSLALPIAVLLLLLVTTAGVVWHHHSGLAADNCPICHMSHQTVGPAVAHVRVSQPVWVGGGPEPQAVHLVDDSVPRDVPVRGPPA